MKLSQSILISLTLLICFSPIISAMEEQYHQLIDINPAHENDFIEQLKEKHDNFFINNDEYQLKQSKILLKIHKFIINQIKTKYIYVISSLILYIIFLQIFLTKFSNSADVHIGSVLISFFVSLFLIGRTRSDLGETLEGSIFSDSPDRIRWFWLHFSDLNTWSNGCYRKPLIVKLSKFNKIEIAKKVLKKWECVPEKVHGNGANALDWALENNNFEMTKLLLDENRHKKFDLDLAVTNAILKKCSNQIIELLFDKSGKFIVEDFFRVIENDSGEAVKLLADLEIDVNIKDENGTPAITIAVLKRKIQAVGSLLTKEINLDAVDAQGKTVFDYLDNWVQNEYSQEMKEKFKKFRQRIARQIYQDLEEFKFPQDHADLISEYLV